MFCFFVVRAIYDCQVEPVGTELVARIIIMISVLLESR